MSNRHRFPSPAAAVLALALPLAGCPGGDEPGDVISGKDELAACTTSDDCAALQPGTVCGAGLCVPGECDALLQQPCRDGALDSPFCCAPFELCNALNNLCEFDPTTGLACQPGEESCTPCGTDDDCRGGQFCSGARCLDVAGRDDCVTSFDCPDGQRCDRTEFLCVPDRGACQFCADFPDLCCEADQLCSTQTGFCLDIEDPECDTGADCGLGEPLCNDDTKQCVQCVVDEDCGPNLLCDAAVGSCFSEDLFCDDDDDCNGNARCALAIDQCVLPQCESDAGCASNPQFDERFECDEGTFRCFLPPPVCTEDAFEPNDTIDDAAGLIDGNRIDAVLCRGGDDFFSFPVAPETRYTVTIDFGESGQQGISATLFGTNNVVEGAPVTFRASDERVDVVGVTAAGESGLFKLKLQGNNTDSDQWSYTVTVAESEPSLPADCTPAGQAEEPNDSFDTATPINLGELRTLSRCGLDDVDFYRVTVPPQHGIHAELDGFFNAEGNLDLQLFSAPNQSVATSATFEDLEEVDGVEGAAEFFLRVSLAGAGSALTDQSYRIGAEAVARPAACAGDGNEIDDTAAQATVLTLAPDALGNPGITVPDPAVPGAPAPLRCNAQDVDHFRFSMPPNLGGVVRLRFAHGEGDIKLELRDATGATLLDSSNTSTPTSEIDEQVEVPGDPTNSVDFVARVLLNGSSGGTIGQPYTLEIVTFDVSQCIASEPAGGDDAFGDGRCIGDWTPLVVAGGANACVNEGARIPEPMLTATPAACAGAPDGTIAGCGRVCGNDDADWYRVGPVVDDAVIHAVLEYDFDDGELALVRGVLNGNGTVTETTTSDTDDDGVVEFSFATPRGAANLKEYGVRVKTVGNTGHQVQPYALRIEVGASCIEDPEDVGAASNGNPADATLIAAGRAVDEPLAFDSSTFFDPDGAGGPAPPIVSSRCSNDTDVYEFFSFAGETVQLSLAQADTSPSGLVVELGTRPDDLDDPAVVVASGSAGGAPVVFANPTNQQLFVTVRAPPGVVVTGPYTLLITTTRP